MGATVKDLRSKAQLEEALRQKSSAALHFWASWCPASAQLDAIFSHLSSENPNTHFFRVEAEETPDISEAYNVSAVPFFVFIKDGVVVDKLEGANPADLAEKVTQLSGSGGQPQKRTEVEEAIDVNRSAAESMNGTTATGNGKGMEEKLKGLVSMNGTTATGNSKGMEEKLKGLVSSKPVMLFMKGSPDEPKCGFSRRVVEVLKDLGVEIGSFDILQDEEVRQSLKAFSNWPTYPQLYIAGEFIGGCDLIAEMRRSGELEETLKDKGVVRRKESLLEGRLKKLIDASPTMLFMKGSPKAPRCGFGSKVVNALREEGVSFGSFDILSDMEVREGLKKYSNWPTYPQLYHHGELVGGCDIVLELKASGELKAELS